MFTGIRIGIPSASGFVGPSLDAQVQAALVGKNAVMLDMTDLSTLYQQYPNGGTAFDVVTTLGQGLGTTLDKSKKSSWTDNTGSTWTKSSGDGVVTVVGNVITITGATTTTRVDRVGGTIPLVAGVAVFDVTAGWASATGPIVWCRGAPQTPPNGTAQKIVASLAASTLERVQIDSGTATFTINSLKYWEGNHATQPTAGSRPLLQTNNGKYAAQFDGTDDALILPNIAWTGGALNSFVALNIGASTKGVHIWRTADSVSGYWGVWESGVGISPTGGAVGLPTYAVNGVAVSSSTRAQLYTMMNSQNTVLESIGVTLSANSALQIGGYGLPYALSGPVHRVLLVEGTLTAPQIALFRTWTGQGIGLTL